jgi:hypothetical protein
MTTCPFTETAKEIAAEASAQLVLPLTAVGFWHADLSRIALRIDDGRGLRAATSHYLRTIAWWASALLTNLGVQDPAALFVAEYERAAIKHPGMTLDADGPTDENRFYALAEEVGEVAASLTYDNAQGTGHGADTIAEVTQVGALALAWLARYQDGGER